MEIIGQIVYGEFSEIIFRVKQNSQVEIGEIVSVIDNKTGKKYLYKISNIKYGSQLSFESLERVAGIELEKEESKKSENRDYLLASLVPLLKLEDKGKHTKGLPEIHSKVYRAVETDFKFIEKPQKSIYLGKLRSGSREIDIDISLKGSDVLTHHMLICATTGRGKSNFLKNMLWDSVEKDNMSFVIFDPHDEYYGRHELGLKDHPKSNEFISYYSVNPPMSPNCKTLAFSIDSIKPWHFNGILGFSEPQKQVMDAYYNTYGDDWVLHVLKRDKLPEDLRFMDASFDVVVRRLRQILSISYIRSDRLDQKHKDKEVIDGYKYEGIFRKSSGKATINEIIKEVLKGNKIIIDTSSLSNELELLISSMITTEIFSRYKWERKHETEGLIKKKEVPAVSIVLEEAPRVLGREALESGGNIFSTLAREGRKFKVGVLAITQLPSLIPKEILANLNTKIILGLEMAQERLAIINSSSQDLTHDEKAIASLDKGEALVSSIFSMFAIPIKIPLFKEFIRKELEDKRSTFKDNSFSGFDIHQ